MYIQLLMTEVWYLTAIIVQMLALIGITTDYYQQEIYLAKLPSVISILTNWTRCKRQQPSHLIRQVLLQLQT